MMLYDPFVVHAGGGRNPGYTCYRRCLFVTFASSDLGKADVRDMQMTKNLDGYRTYDREFLLRLLNIEAGRAI